eukprot:1141416-Pelagomonas_calceolata.AAC.1
MPATKPDLSLKLKENLEVYNSLHAKDDKYWVAQLIKAFHGLQSSKFFEQAMRSGGAIPVNDSTADSRYRMQGVWCAELVDPRGNNDELATYQAWFAAPFTGKAVTTKVCCSESVLQML